MSRLTAALSLVGMTAFLSGMQASAATYYCDPGAGSMTNSGSATSPWSSLQAVFASGKTFAAGDTIYLRDGDHGFPVITADNTGDVTITKEAGHDPMVRRIDFSGATHWVLDGIRVYRPDGPLPQPVPLIWPVAPLYADSLVRIANTSSYITVRNCTVYSADDVSAWTADDWNTKAWSGIFMASLSHHLTIEKCTVLNTNFAIHMEGNTSNIDVLGNFVKNFCGDGIRANCNDLRIEDNVVLDAYGTNGNHYDMIQGFARARVQIRNNVLISTTSSRPLTANTQGIGAFDGWMDNWVVENNLVAVNHFHGLTLLGARNSRVVNNTVIKNPYYTGSQSPWITISNHSNGTAGSGNVMRNNLSSNRPNSSFPVVGTTQSNNIISTNYTALFVNYAAADFHLKATSAAVNAGTELDAPLIDLDHAARSAPYDVGAFEYQVPNSVPSITATTLPGGIVGENYSQILAATGGNGALVWSMRSGDLPAGLSLSAEGLISGSATTAGTASFTVGVADSDGINDITDEDTQSLSITISPAVATVALTDLTQVYDGSPRSVAFSTNPAGVAVSVTYDGNSSAPANAGSYAVVATVTDPNYIGEATGTLVVEPASAGVVLTNLGHTYDGTPKSATVTTSPAGLSVTLTYDGASAVPSATGTYAVTAEVNDLNYHGSASGTLVISPAPATVTLSDLNHLYDGTPKAPTVTTNPAGLTVDIIYANGVTFPTYPGSYEVVGMVRSSNYNGTASGTLFIGTTALVRHAPVLNAGLDGSLQMLAGENTTLNGSAWVSGDLLVPGTPTMRLNGNPHFGGVVAGTGAMTPAEYLVTLNGGAALRHVVQRIDAVMLPTVSAPPAPSGTVNLTINNSNYSTISWGALRNLTLNGNVGQVVVPAGTYGAFVVNGNNEVVLGVPGASEPAEYNLQNLSLNGSSRLLVVGPIVLTLANGLSLNSSMGDVAHPEWLVVRVASGGVTLNGNVTLSGTVLAPNGTVAINGNSTLVGSVVSDHLVINGSGLLTDPEPSN